MTERRRRLIVSLVASAVVSLTVSVAHLAWLQRKYQSEIDQRWAADEARYQQFLQHGATVQP